MDGNESINYNNNNNEKRASQDINGRFRSQTEPSVAANNNNPNSPQQQQQQKRTHRSFLGSNKHKNDEKRESVHFAFDRLIDEQQPDLGEYLDGGGGEVDVANVV